MKVLHYRSNCGNGVKIICGFCCTAFNWKFFYMKCFAANQYFTFLSLMGMAMGTVLCVNGDGCCREGMSTGRMLKL